MFTTAKKIAKETSEYAYVITHLLLLKFAKVRHSTVVSQILCVEAFVLAIIHSDTGALYTISNYVALDGEHHHVLFVAFAPIDGITIHYQKVATTRRHVKRKTTVDGTDSSRVNVWQCWLFIGGVK